MAAVNDAPGHFRLERQDGPAEHNLWTWALYNADGDLIAVSPFPMGELRARETANWVIQNAKDFVWDTRRLTRPVG